MFVSCFYFFHSYFVYLHFFLFLCIYFFFLFFFFFFKKIIFFLICSIMKIIFKKNCIFVWLDARPPVFPKDPIYSQQVQWVGVCPGRPALRCQKITTWKCKHNRPCPALFVRQTNRHHVCFYIYKMGVFMLSVASYLNQMFYGVHLLCGSPKWQV
jgi:hypothetical protein